MNLQTEFDKVVQDVVIPHWTEVKEDYNPKWENRAWQREEEDSYTNTIQTPENLWSILFGIVVILLVLITPIYFVAARPVKEKTSSLYDDYTKEDIEALEKFFEKK